MKGFLRMLPVLALALLGVFSAVCLCALRRRKVRAADCLIVPGAKVRADGRLSHTLRYRCERAFEAWEAGVAWNVIVCGGKGSDEPVAEAEAMRTWLIERGIPEERVIVERRSANTRQNLIRAKAIMQKQGWRSAAIVTSDYHVQRALWLARDLGIAACGVSAPSPRTVKGWLSARIRETVSWLLYGLHRLFS